jgi:hypothetical protein
MRMYYLRFGLALALLLLSATVSLAQTSSLSGTVYDPSGAVIGGAAVKAVHDATGVTFTQITNEAGLYSFPSIAAGAYTVTIEIPGFKTVKRTGITLNVGTPSVQNFNLEVGGSEQTVRVEASAASVNTSNATLGNVIERSAVVALPLNGRNPLNLIVLEPGVQQNGNGGDINVNGMRGQSANVTIDGIGRLPSDRSTTRNADRSYGHSEPKTGAAFQRR